MSESRNLSRPSRRIPDFNSRDVEAEWWDTHSITDYVDELEPVHVRFAKSQERLDSLLITPNGVRGEKIAVMITHGILD
jgi:hypothetical protein